MEYHNHDRPYLGIKGLTPLSHLAFLSTALSETTLSPYVRVAGLELAPCVDSVAAVPDPCNSAQMLQLGICRDGHVLRRHAFPRR